MIFLGINFHFQKVDNSALSSDEYYTLPAQTEDIVDLKGGLLSNTVCTVKVPVREFNISRIKHTLNLLALQFFVSARIYINTFCIHDKMNFFWYKEFILPLPCNKFLWSLSGQPVPL